MPEEDLVPSTVKVEGNNIVLPNGGKTTNAAPGTASSDYATIGQLNAAVAASAADVDAEQARATTAEGLLVPKARTLGLSAPAFSGAGDLSANRNIQPVFGDQPGTFCEGNDPRLDGGNITFGTTAGTAAEGNDARFQANANAITAEAAARQAADGQHDAALLALTERRVNAGTGLSGGGDLTADRTLSVAFGTTAGTVAAGNDPRFGSGGVPPERTLGFDAPAFTGGGDLSANRTIAPVFGDQAGTFCEGNDPRLAGLGSDIVFGTGPGEVTEGNDSRFTTLAGSIAALEAGLADETAAREAADTTAFNDLVAEGGYRAAGDTANETAIVTEVNRATAAEALLAPQARTITAGTGLTGGGDLSANRTLAVDFGTAAGTVAAGNDARLSDARTPTTHAASHAGGGADAIANATTSVAGLMSGADKTKLDGLPAAAVPTSRSVTAGTGLTGGGTLAADRSFAVAYGTAAGTAAEGNDSRITSAVPNTRTVTAGTGLTGGGDLSANRTFACSFGTTTGTVCQGDDTRVVNAVQSSRQVLAGTGLTGGGTLAADRTLAVSFGTTSTTACVGNDTRVVNAVQTTRTITAGTGLTGGGDLTANRTLACSFGTLTGTVCEGNDTRVVNAVQNTRQVLAGTGLTGGGTLAADRTLTVSYGTAAGTACQGNDARLSDARTPTAHAASHVGGSDPIANATTSVAGLMSAADKTKLDGTPASCVPTTRTISAGTGLTGGGDLTADRTLTVSYGTTAGTAAEGNDARITGAVPNTRTVSAGTGLTGGGDLSANRTLAVSYGTSAGTACEGNDARLSKSVTLAPVSGTYNVTSADNGAILQVDTSAARTINLPSPSGLSGFNFVVKDATGGAATNAISLVRAGAEQIEGVAATKTLSIIRGSWFVYTDGTNWFVNGPS